jgi:hypothetical protein
LQNPAPWIVETLQIMGCLPPINWCRISQPFTVAMENGMFVQDKHDDLPINDCDFH